MRKKSICIMVFSIALVLLVLTGCGSEAEKAMDEAVTTANELLDNNKNKPLDPKTKTDLKRAVKNSEEADDDDAYKKATEEITAATKAFEDSVKQLKQVTKPKEEFLVERAKTVKTVTKVEAATEKTDGNKMLHKEGGYTSYIAMKSSMVKDDFYNDQSAVEAGCDGGAVIEAFKTTKEAKKREEYLAGFDGNGMLDSGSHKVVGTLLVRTSNELTATQQKQLEKNIIEALTRLE